MSSVSSANSTSSFAANQQSTAIERYVSRAEIANVAFNKALITAEYETKELSSLQNFFSSMRLSDTDLNRNDITKMRYIHYMNGVPATLSDASIATEILKGEDILSKINKLAQLIQKTSYRVPSLETIFQAAIKEGESDVVTALIGQGVSVLALVEGISPLYTACENGKEEIAELLLKNGANPTQKNDLSYRCKQDHYYSLDPTYIKKHDATPMKGAIEAGNTKLVRLLARYNAPLDEPGPSRRSPVFNAVDSDHEELALFFIESGVNINLKDIYGNSLMLMAIARGQLRVVQELVKRGLAVTDRADDGQTSLDVAAGRGKPEIVDFLLKNGARGDINDLWLGKWTPLSTAVESGNLKIVELLVNSGADLSLKYEGQDILELAEAKLSKVESYCKENPESTDREKIPKYQSVIDYLQKVVEKSVQRADIPTMERKGNQVQGEDMAPVSFSDGTSWSKSLVQHTISQICGALNNIGAVEKIFFLADLQDKAHHEDSWVPALNPICNTIKLMKAYFLVDGLHHMLPHVKSIIKDCIVGENFNIKLQIPERLQ